MPVLAFEAADWEQLRTRYALTPQADARSSTAAAPIVANYPPATASPQARETLRER